MLKFGSPSITLYLLVQNCTVKVGCTVCISRISSAFQKIFLKPEVSGLVGLSRKLGSMKFPFCLFT